MDDLIINYLNLKGLNPRALEKDDKDTLLGFTLTLNNAICDTFIDIRKLDGYVLITSYYPVKIPLEYYPQINEYLSRINDYINYGCFKLNFNTGYIYYYASFMFEDAYETYNAILQNTIEIICLTFDDYIPGINQIVFADSNPLNTFNQIINATNPKLN